MIISRSKLNQYFFLIFLIGLSQGNSILQFASIGVLGIFGLILIKNQKIVFKRKDIFYLMLIFLSFVQLLLFYKEDYSLNYIINSSISVIMWMLMFISSLLVVKLIRVLDKKKIENVLKWFFVINVLFMVIQYISLCIEHLTLIPFLTSMGAGDYVKGIFSNSSINMIINSFYLIYFVYLKEKAHTFFALLGMLFTTYMSGIVLFTGVVLLFAFLYLPLRLKGRLIVGAVSGIIMFSILSPNNARYVKMTITKKLFAKSDQARKIISFEQTASQLTSSFPNFFIGSGGGKFSSRTAFMTGGEYVGWYPKRFIYLSSEFKKNHFQLWNIKTLSIPYKDGTANQPFSFYNKIFGEYGVIGFSFFILFYLYSVFKNYKKLTYAKLIVLLMLTYFILDYWFEYFTVIVFFEIFLFLDLKKEINE